MKKTLFIFAACLTMIFSIVAASSWTTAEENANQEAYVRIYEEKESLSAGEVYSADGINNYADENSEAKAKTAFKDETTDVVRLEAETFSFGLLIRSFVIGTVAAVVIVGGMAAQHKSVIKKYGASDYLKKDSFTLTGRKDIFLYKNVIKSKRQKNDK